MSDGRLSINDTDDTDDTDDREGTTQYDIRRVHFMIATYTIYHLCGSLTNQQVRFANPYINSIIEYRVVCY
jgi:hypothetical protein